MSCLPKPPDFAFPFELQLSGTCFCRQHVLHPYTQLCCWSEQEFSVHCHGACFPCLLLLLSRLSHVRLCATPQTAVHHAPPSLGFSRQEHWNGLPFPSPMHESEKWKWSHSVATPWTAAPRFLHPWDFPGKSTGVGCHCLLRCLLLGNCLYLWNLPPEEASFSHLYLFW